MTDILLLFPHPENAHPDPGLVKTLLRASRGSLVSFHIPKLAPDGRGLEKEQFASYHYQAGNDLSTVGPEFRLREVVLLKSPAKSSSHFVLAYLWSFPDSTFDVDAVRIPRGGRNDPRNSPMGKNPGNIWAFSRPLGSKLPGTQFTLDVSDEIPAICSGRIEVPAIQRFVTCHTKSGDRVMVWGVPREVDSLEKVVAKLGRRFDTLSSGSADPPPSLELAAETPPVMASPLAKNGVLPASGGVDSPPGAHFYICDCRFGLEKATFPPVSDVVTSPPYNYSYSPFNVPRPDRKTGELVSPERVGYSDEMSAPKYRGLLKSTFEAIDRRLDPSSADVFVNIKNNYGGAQCIPPFWLIRLVPDSWALADLLIWRYDISFDPARLKYKPYYEWVLRFARGDIRFRKGHRYLRDFYLPILKGNSLERLELAHPAIYPKELVKQCLGECSHQGLVLDPFLGSGSTLAAATELGRASVGFELDGKYVHDIETRLKGAKRPNPSEYPNGGRVLPPEFPKEAPIFQH